ncbi:hypothetical protein [Mycolicibacterium aubagnense]|uniref:Uncharacterized protein n=1 Tax=Mycolicibacterium aubagnense TaxID=319707 RepID=A0ABN5Z116_9MYCO|nr:hypothetical protein [Mycolicibacterium aubagnense]TLH66795.1 hypothetical protein C1S80_06925 [Mycolicibacterium aubagnense]WGI31615.1 hypothetical protein QDT91_20640 [Mycolicibacterium aubagnense]BBX86916.1 hypothetical protein MAUB_47890 [Mycolicibacterium aubagnense]
MALDMKLLRQLSLELGFWPATADPEDIGRHRRLNKALEAAPSPEKVARKFAHLHTPRGRLHHER